MLDRRLQTCYDMIGGEGIVCDVGTDHALLAAELVRSGKCGRVIASDIKEGPLEAARRTAERYGLTDEQVTLVLSDGLESVPLNGVSDIVIAGMGGETIADIIGRALFGPELGEDVRFVLQPMTKPEILRKKLYEYGFEITAERAVEDGSKLYTVMTAERSSAGGQLTETAALYGFFDIDDPLTSKYREHEADRLTKVASSLEASGKLCEAVHYRALAQKLRHGMDIVSLNEIYDFLDSLYPFALQEKWDNSGLLVENTSMECRSILLSLDITSTAASEAAQKCIDLIISHHPVIFEPRRRITRTDPVYRLISADIAALCMHTNLDIAAGGTNGVILQKLTERFAVSGEPEPFEELGGDSALGWILTLADSISPTELAKAAKEIFGCEYVRMTRCSTEKVQRIAFCSGSGGSSLAIAAEKGCDAYITGDVKHDVWVDSANLGVCLLDCGHFHTENPVLWELRRVLEERFPQLDIEIAESSSDPCVYV